MKLTARFSPSAMSLFAVIAVNLVTFISTSAIAQECAYRGELDTLYCDENRDLVAKKDYKILFSGKHDQSVMGVNSGDCDAAAVASDVYHRMASRGQIREDDFRIIYKSQKFPTSSFAYAHDLEPALAAKMVKCFTDYRFTFEGSGGREEKSG